MNIWVNGCFDILHTGHIDLLWYAKLYSDDINELTYLDKNKLFVGLDSDERVKLLKGHNRPINDAETRMKIMSNLRMVNDVVIFHNDNELKYYIKIFNIDYIIIGDQYKDKEVIGRENAKWGVVYYPVDDRSTTNIIDKIKNL
jgi:cytidyltransferase-like protein